MKDTLTHEVRQQIVLKDKVYTVCGLITTSCGRGAFYYRAKHDRKDMWTR